MTVFEFGGYSRRNALPFSKWAVQNSAELLECVEGCLQDNSLYACKRGYASYTRHTATSGAARCALSLSLTRIRNVATSSCTRSKTTCRNARVAKTVTRLFSLPRVFVWLGAVCRSEPRVTTSYLRRSLGCAITQHVPDFFGTSPLC